MASSLEHRLVQSQRLHEQVRAFATQVLSAQRGPDNRVIQAWQEQTFERLACDIASFQTGGVFENLQSVVRRAVPADCFKFGQVFRLPPNVATRAFRTSGTTASNTGVHFMRDAYTYEHLSLVWGELAMGLSSTPTPIIVALAPWTGPGTSSSLGYMMQRMMERFDGKGLTEQRSQAGFRLDAPLRWLISEHGVDVAGLRHVAELAFQVNTRVILLATSFALVELLDALGTATLPLPTGSTVMPTGGFKGRTRSIEPEVMAAELRRVFGDIDLVGEYGMTELSSQLYEGTGRHGQLEASPGVYLEPPWLRVVPLSATDLCPIPEGEVGLACFVDLGNVDSAVALVTQDLVRREGPGIRLFGRQAAAPLRGCSLAIEALLHPSAIEPMSQEEAHEPSPTLEDPASERDAAKCRVTSLLHGAREAQRALLADKVRLEELARASFMSVQGAELALTTALETHPTSNEVEELVACARAKHVRAGAPVPTVWVVLSATVFTAAHRAAALALSVSPRVKLKPSRRQPHFARALEQASGGLFEVVDDLEPGPLDLVMVYGSDETLGDVRQTLPASVRFDGYGHGMGVAVVGAGADLDESARGLALDMVLFEQQGCLSPRLAFLDVTCDARAFVDNLTAALTNWQVKVPLGQQASAHLAQAAWERRVASTFAHVTPCGAGWIAEYPEQWCHENRVPLSNSPRSIALVHARQPLALLGAISKLVTCIGVAGDEQLRRDITRVCPSARRVELGAMQCPRFDGPVDRRSLRS